MRGKCSRSRMPRMTRAVRRSGSTFTPRVSTPSRASCSTMNLPMCSSPTPVITADLNPSRAVPKAMFVGEPPMYFSNDPMSSSRQPICAPYRSTPDPPMVMTSSAFMIACPVKSGFPQELPARSQVCEDAAGVAWVTFLLDGDVSAVADFGQKFVQSETADPAFSDRVHHSFGAGVEEPDMAVHDVGVFRVVGVLEVDVVRAVGVAPEGRDRVHPGVVHMAGVEAKPRDFSRNVFDDAIELVLELDIAAGVWVDDRPNAVMVPRQLRDGADVGDHPDPGLRVEARSAFGMSGRVVALLAAPVHHSNVRRGEALAQMRLRPRQSGYERANLVCLAQQVLPVLRANQIVEDRARHDPEPAGLERGSDPRCVERHVAVGPELQPAKARHRGLVQHALPVRQMRVGHVVHPPAAGRAGNGDGQGHVTALRLWSRNARAGASACRSRRWSPASGAVRGAASASRIRRRLAGLGRRSR